VAETPNDIDRRASRRRFERSARSYPEAARLEAEIGARMLERLDLVRIAPRRILDAGSGIAREARELAARYRGTSIVALDFSAAMLRQARRRRGLRDMFLRGARPLAVCADLERLPLAAESIDMVWSNMALHWVPESIGVLREFYRVLAPGGLLMFSTLGPDTLKELRAVAGADRVHQFLDMHDIGDRLVSAEFADPVMDMEMITVGYPGPGALLDELRLTGQTNALRDRPKGLSGRRFLARLRTGLAARMPDGKLSVSWEVVYGHAWKGARRRKVGANEPRPIAFPRLKRK
jgi:malonyl-CoA O-methyltransferase